MGSILTPLLMTLLSFQDSTIVREAQRPPDILILLSDQHLSSAVGFEATPGFRTPAIDRLASDGLVFREAFCTSPQCSPSRASIMTGRYPHQTGVFSNLPNPPTDPVEAGESAPLPNGTATLAHALQDAGYETAYFGKWHLGGDPREFGFEHAFTEDFYGRMTLTAVDFLTGHRPGFGGPEGGSLRRPLFLVASWLNPHDIYNLASATPDMLTAVDEVDVPESISDDLSGKPSPQRIYLEEDQGMPFVGATEQNWRRYRAFYSYLVEEVDNDIRQVATAFRDLSPGGLVIFAADHGDFGGAHGLPYKGPAMYDELLRVPLIINWPGRVPPGETDALVSLMDLYPTLCEIGGAPVPNSIEGRSLLPLLETPDRDSVPWRDSLVMQYYGKSQWRVPIRCLRTRDFKYVRYRFYGEELYDLLNDPQELVNLADDPSFSAIRNRLSTDLNRWIVAEGDDFFSLTVTDRAGVEIEFE